jgi:methyl-accepting chemotaxis protein
VSRTLNGLNTTASETTEGARQASGSSRELLDYAHEQQKLLQRFSI